MTGTIKKIVEDRGFGFIAPEPGTECGRRDVFFHASGLANGVTFEQFAPGHRVEFEIIPQEDKRLRAGNVRPA